MCRQFKAVLMASGLFCQFWFEHMYIWKHVHRGRLSKDKVYSDDGLQSASHTHTLSLLPYRAVEDDSWPYVRPYWFTSSQGVDCFGALPRCDDGQKRPFDLPRYQRWHLNFGFGLGLGLGHVTKGDIKILDFEMVCIWRLVDDCLGCTPYFSIFKWYVCIFGWYHVIIRNPETEPEPDPTLTSAPSVLWPNPHL